MIYAVHYDRANRYERIIEAVGPEEAIEAFWDLENLGENDEDERVVNSSGPTGLSMTDRFGTPVIWGQPTSL
jgi:hypothetical protein